MKISTDEKLNPRLRGHVQTLRGSMVEALNKNPLPQRFTQTEHPDQPAVIIKDSVTGRELTVGLCDAHGARKALAAFFD
jgi:hypothetical protein